MSSLFHTFVHERGQDRKNAGSTQRVLLDQSSGLQGDRFICSNARGTRREHRRGELHPVYGDRFICSNARGTRREHRRGELHPVYGDRFICSNVRGTRREHRRGCPYSQSYGSRRSYRYLIPLTINYNLNRLFQVKFKFYGDKIPEEKTTGEMTKISFPRDPTCTLFQASRELMGSKSLHLSGFATSGSPTDTGDIKRQAPFQNRR